MNDNPNVLQAVRGLKTWNTDVRKFTKRRIVPSSLHSLEFTPVLQNKYGAVHKLVHKPETI